MIDPKQDGAGALALDRRGFLVYGSLGIAGLWLGGFGAAAPAAAATLAEESTAVAAARPMSLGYVLGSEEIPNLRYLPRRIRSPRPSDAAAKGPVFNVVPADSLPSGDTSLVGRALRLKIHGLYPPDALAEARRSKLPLAVDLDVVFPAPDPVFPKPARFFAWSFRRRPGWEPSPPLSFVFPLDWQVMPQIDTTVTPAKGGQKLALSTRFTLDQDTGRPRLRRGVYLLGLAPDTWKADLSLPDLARTAPTGLVSILLSVESEPLKD
ncbi:MAG TPA: hypothetical protein VOA87_11345 [Thermoanaerobaculia bacterium]|nr:hypothetical protein [Thermoanaerobaculia bacterium]